MNSHTSIYVIILLSLLVVSGQTIASIINIPDDFETIQEGIDGSEDGDTVLVAHGEYEDSLNFNGMAITLLGDPENPEEVVIDGGHL